MAIHIICPPGSHGGVISGRVDSPIPPDSKICIEQLEGGRWVPRQSETGDAVAVPAAHLWSCNLRHQDAPASRWRARLVTQHAGGSASITRQPDGRLASRSVRASPVSITDVPGDAGGKLKGTIARSARRHSRVVLPFFWHSTPLHVPALSGWIPFGHLVETRPDGSWEVEIGSAVQYAVLHVPDDFYQTYKGRAHLPLGTLPVDGVLAAAFASTIDIVVLTKPDRPLTGAVTGLGGVYDNATPLEDERPPLPENRLWIAAWAVLSENDVRIIKPISCEPNGQWSFGTLEPSLRSAPRFVVAVTTAGFTPTTARPSPGGEVGKVIAVAEVER
jgi:hypothetical protein